MGVILGGEGVAVAEVKLLMLLGSNTLLVRVRVGLTETINSLKESERNNFFPQYSKQANG